MTEDGEARLVLADQPDGEQLAEAVLTGQLGDELDVVLTTVTPLAR